MGTATASRNLVGWTAGAGWEYAFADHWTVKAEYLIAGFPKTSALKVESALDTRNYQKGIKISKAAMKCLDITGDQTWSSPGH